MIYPEISHLNANSAGIMNAIRYNASAEYQNAVPVVENTTESIRAAGNAILAFQPRMNEFISALVNRIALVVVTSKSWENPLAWAKKGIIENGETVEEIFINLIKGQPYNMNGTAEDVYKLYSADVKSAFHPLNWKTVYPLSINQKELALAFTSRNGVTDLVSRMVNSMYTSLWYDEYIMTKYLIAILALDGKIASRSITAPTTATAAEGAIIEMKTAHNAMKFFNTEFNIAGVNNHAENVYFLTTGAFDARTDVEVLAKAFNMDKANWAGQHIMVDSFGFTENELDRLDTLLSDDATYTRLTSTQNDALKTIHAVLMGDDFFQIYNNGSDMFTENFNGFTITWNEFLHAWRTFSASPFANVVMFSSEGNNVNVSVSTSLPTSSSISLGASVNSTPVIIGSHVTPIYPCVTVQYGASSSNLAYLTSDSISEHLEMGYQGTMEKSGNTAFISPASAIKPKKAGTYVFHYYATGGANASTALTRTLTVTA